LTFALGTFNLKLSNFTMLDIQKLEVGPLDACCYIVSSKGSEAMIIDPGGDTERILDCLEQKKLHPVLLVNTHGHGDHIGANKELKEKFPDIKICIHTDDAEMLRIHSKTSRFWAEKDIHLHRLAEL